MEKFMKIYRDNKTFILKRKIDLKHLNNYDEEKISKAKNCLKKIINETVVDDFIFLEELRKLSNNNIKENYNNFKNNVCYNCCTSLSVNLKKELDKILGKTYLVTCKSIGFSTSNGDKKIKEAHTFVIYPCIKNNKILFIFFDAGFRNYNPIMFYMNEDSNDYSYETGIAKIIYQNNRNYPYLLKLNKILKRNFKVEDTNILLPFNPYYETVNILEFDKECYRAKHSYKIMDYLNHVCIGLNIISGKLTLYYNYNEEKYNLNELLELNNKEIKNILMFYFNDLNKDLDEFINMLRFIPKWVNSKVIYDEVMNDIKNNY